jgi:alanine racemase
MTYNTSSHPSWIEIDLAQFRRNITTIRSQIGKSLFCLPVKANAYGHGLCRMGRAAEDAGVDYLAVAHLREGVELRLSGVKIPILVLGAIHEDQIRDLIEFNLEISISSQFKAELVAAECKKLGKKCCIHMEVDTGMQRTGVRASTAEKLLPFLKTLGALEVVGVYSHLATADNPDDPFALKQIATFSSLKKSSYFQGMYHLANSNGTIYFPQSHFDMVRPSIITFGYVPKNCPEAYQAIAPCFSLKAKVAYFKVVEKGRGISYGHSYVTQRQTRVVTVPVGYGDGFRRSLSNQGSVLIRGKRFPIRGTICMDQFMVDVGDEEIYVGDEVVLIGKQGSEEISLNEVAELCETIPYEILCQFNERIPRIYVEDKY